MKKTFLTREYTTEPRQGTLNMKETRCFFGSKILEIEDVLRLGAEPISWQENLDHTQGIGLDNQLLSLDMALLKAANHTVQLHPLQSEAEKRDFTKWVFTFNIKDMVRQYLFARLKAAGTFANIANRNTRTNDVNAAVYDYIDHNVLPRLRFDTVVFYVRYVALSDQTTGTGVALQYDTKFDANLLNIPALSGETNAQYQQRKARYQTQANATNFQLTTDLYGDVATLTYKQVESSQAYKFDFYFDVIYVKA